uniref:Ig-like domain-containing protein n=1 Tax=Cyprinodon variegatus TaxID=28743 RepID=A0A3Q2GKQ8_CYPVA
MLVFIWLTVSLSTNKGALGWGEQFCQHLGYCVNFENITAEAGLCAVIPCSFTSRFEPKYIIWYKCEYHKEICRVSDTVFNSDKRSSNVQSGFKGRVSLLEPDVTQKNCSIIVNDLRVSDSGYYQLRVEGEGEKDKFTFTVAKLLLSVTDLNQKAELKIPPLTDGQQVTLTCTAPGFCSGSPPIFTWMWRRKAENSSHIPGNITASTTENLTAVAQSHSSTLTFKPSVENHNTDISCKVSFIGGKTTEETATLNVNFNPMNHCDSGYGVLPWVVAGVSLGVNVLCMIQILVLW